MGPSCSDGPDPSAPRSNMARAFPSVNGRQCTLAVRLALVHPGPLRLGGVRLSVVGRGNVTRSRTASGGDSSISGRRATHRGRIWPWLMQIKTGFESRARSTCFNELVAGGCATEMQVGCLLACGVWARKRDVREVLELEFSQFLVHGDVHTVVVVFFFGGGLECCFLLVLSAI